jgi:hypothetical protein
LAGVDGVVNAYRDCNQGKLNVAFPDCSHRCIVRLKNERGAANLLKMFQFKNP